MTLHFTEAAAKEIKRMQASRHPSQSYFRLAIKQGGCSGWYYLLELSQSQAGDHAYEVAGISVFLDAQSFPYLKNMRLDYAEDLMGGGFRFDNPNTTTSCSCGLSFALKEAHSPAAMR